MAELTTAQVWNEIDKQIFAVVGMVTANKEFITYGIGVSLQTMRDTVKARGRVTVN